jgi:hypothetical protein
MTEQLETHSNGETAVGEVGAFTYRNTFYIILSRDGVGIDDQIYWTL